MRSSLSTLSPPATVFEIRHAADERKVLAYQDFWSGIAAYRLFTTLAWLDIKLRYRGSILGPFWLTLSTAVWALSMGVLYSQLFQMDTPRYLPYLALALVLWNAINSVVSESCNCFTSAEGTIRSLRQPYTIYATRTIYRNFLIMLHNIPVVLGIFGWFNSWPGWEAFACLPGLALWLLDGLAACLLLGTLCARFRDLGPIVASVMQIAFFLTPIIWQPELIGPDADLLLLNPFYPILAVVMNPLLSRGAGLDVWATALGWSILLCAASWFLFIRVRGRLAFWV